MKLFKPKGQAQSENPASRGPTHLKPVEASPISKEIVCPRMEPIYSLGKVYPVGYRIEGKGYVSFEKKEPKPPTYKTLELTERQAEIVTSALYEYLLYDVIKSQDREDTNDLLWQLNAEYEPLDHS